MMIRMGAQRSAMDNREEIEIKKGNKLGWLGILIWPYKRQKQEKMFETLGIKTDQVIGCLVWRIDLGVLNETNKIEHRF